ncbi:hypothetical protein C4577_01410 [Candidatus Parcubacteria bacterium]|nr:MAG: hypothetical protein C4577_01410 [Candidatus Parcubacteria bacterium]
MLKNILYIGVLTMISVFVWIGFNLHHSNTTSTIEEPTSIRINPITASFDTKTIDSLKSRKSISIDLKEVLKISTPSPTTLPTIMPTDIPAETPSLENNETSESAGQENQEIPASSSGDIENIL